MRGITQEELAKNLDVSIGFIVVLESGKRGIKLEILMNTCKVLKVAPNDLLIDDDSFEELENDRLLLDAIAKLNIKQKRL